MSRLDEAFAAVDAVHSSEAFEDYQYLTLECLGISDWNGSHEVWAATFDFTYDDSEWFETQRIKSYPTAARGTTPEDAIFKAVEKFHALTAKEHSNEIPH